MNRYRFVAVTALLAAVLLTGCNASKDKPQTDAPVIQSKPDDVSAERAKLDPADRALVEAQEWCVVNSDERLGSMGPPLKLDIKGRPVFVCCKGCKKKAEADPDKTLAKVDDLKAKAKAEREAKK
ncbi:Secreted protein OS=Rhodopirellula europaea SH398 GN=RESH_00384 PE=4 SV=1 [Gemmataceae bacterium]|nr:Secreted protein OS=Rhodopirellula europaea SH398 GN=RESH_00384 PE=4 SV=1 [Gemmataceae bacterium]VTU01697.1 Secreted protein OS=Rhodopirellula europaea SH398 GN=RESH_00384 PE=4 SV=1 [Gemmataceae bacterium]